MNSSNTRPKPNKKQDKDKTASRNAKKTPMRNPLRKVPSYILWSSLAVIIIVYIIFFYKTFVGPYSFRWKALYGDVTYPAGDVRGIDISHYQGDVDWEKIKNSNIQGAPISFVFIKATEGSTLWDENFNRNFYSAKKNNILRGAYHYYSPYSSAANQARYFCKMVQLEENDLPPVLDIEDKGSMTNKQLQKEALTWLRIVEKHYGITPILYTGYKFKIDNLNSPDFDRYPYWIAHYYVDSLEYKGQWKFWQHTDAGKIDGIRENIDLNIFNGDYQDLIDLTIK